MFIPGESCPLKSYYFTQWIIINFWRRAHEWIFTYDFVLAQPGLLCLRRAREAWRRTLVRIGLVGHLVGEAWDVVVARPRNIHVHWNQHLLDWYWAIRSFERICAWFNLDGERSLLYLWIGVSMVEGTQGGFWLELHVIRQCLLVILLLCCVLRSLLLNHVAVGPWVRCTVICSLFLRSSRLDKRGVVSHATARSCIKTNQISIN